MEPYQVTLVLCALHILTGERAIRQFKNGENIGAGITGLVSLTFFVWFVGAMLK